MPPDSCRVERAELRKAERVMVPKDWMPKAKMARVICHWTAGAYSVSKTDREHYHIIVGGDGQLVLGDNSIKANESTSDSDGYAAHTKNLNGGSIGIACAAMAGATESPFNAGPYPLKEDQWATLARVAADLCQQYGIVPSPETVLQHGEVQANLGIAQDGKWDICKLPWVPDLTKNEVCTDFRARVMAELEGV